MSSLRQSLNDALEFSMELIDGRYALAVAETIDTIDRLDRENIEASGEAFYAIPED